MLLVVVVGRTVGYLTGRKVRVAYFCGFVVDIVQVRESGAQVTGKSLLNWISSNTVGGPAYLSRHAGDDRPVHCEIAIAHAK